MHDNNIQIRIKIVIIQIIVINKKIKKIVESACKHVLECSSKKTHLIEEDT